jgi:carboxyl-terminal processing protease
VIPLRNGGAVALTTAKYYTPSGRLIQRDYTDLDEYFLDLRDEGGEPEAAAAEPPPESGENHEIFYTLGAGREVFGGGGITPDYIVPAERATVLYSRLIRQNMVFDYAVRYASTHPDLKEGFEFGSQDVASFLAFLGERNFEFDAAAFEQDSRNIVLQIRAQIAKVKWGEVSESRVLAEGDPQIQKALTVFDEAARLAHSDANGGGRNAELIRRQAGS